MEKKLVVSYSIMLSSIWVFIGFRLVLSVLNKNALKFWKSLGFKKEGVERNAHFYDNKYSDGIMMSILENEYRKGHG